MKTKIAKQIYRIFNMHKNRFASHWIYVLPVCVCVRVHVDLNSKRNVVAVVVIDNDKQTH